MESSQKRELSNCYHSQVLWGSCDFFQPISELENRPVLVKMSNSFASHTHLFAGSLQLWFHREKGVDIIRIKMSCPKDPIPLFIFKGENPVTATGKIMTWFDESSEREDDRAGDEIRNHEFWYFGVTRWIVDKMECVKGLNLITVLNVIV